LCFSCFSDTVSFYSWAAILLFMLPV
jgi:hypothetical protein